MALVKQLVVAAFMTALIYVLGLLPVISIPYTPIPLVFQNLGILLAPSILGLYGVISVALLLILALIGFPVLAGGRGGLAVFTGPTAGFLAGYLFTAFIIGFLIVRSWPHLSFLRLLLYNFLGLLCMYVPGVIGFSIISKIPVMNALISTLIFVPGDILKAVIAAYIAYRINNHFPLMNSKRVEDSTYKHSRRNLTIQ